MIKAITSALFVAHLAVHSVSAEMIRFGPGLTNSLIVASNEAVLIQGIFSPDASDSMQVEFTTFSGSLETTEELIVRFDGPPNVVGLLELPPRVLAGPVRIRTLRESSIIFKRLGNSPAQSYLITTNSVLAVEVPTNKCLTIYHPLHPFHPGVGEAVNLIELKEYGDLSAPQFPSQYNALRPGRSYSGPFRTYFKAPSLPNVLTVIVSDDVVQQPDAGALSAGFGQKILTIEESSDLQNWRPSVQTIVGGEDKSFYRFRIDQ